MKAVIVAAGAATRLRPLTDDTPKCLLEVNGMTFLWRLMDQLLSNGIESIGIVAGFQSPKIRAYVRKEFPLTRTKFIINPKFESTGNAFSLLVAREFYLAEEKRGARLEPLMILDGDVWLDASIIPLIKGSSMENVVALRSEGKHDEEEIGIGLGADKTIAKIGKLIPDQEKSGESVGVEMFSPAAAKRMFEILESRVRSGPGRTEFYEATFQQMIEEGIPLRAVDIGSRYAMEVDTIEDLENLKMMARTKK